MYLDVEMGVCPELKFAFKLSREGTKEGVPEGFVRGTSMFPMTVEQRVRRELSEIYYLTENIFATFDAIWRRDSQSRHLSTHKKEGLLSRPGYIRFGQRPSVTKSCPKLLRGSMQTIVHWIDRCYHAAIGVWRGESYKCGADLSLAFW